MLVCDSIVKVSIGDKLKQTRSGYDLHELEFPAYTPDNEVCPVSVAKEYLARTIDLFVRIPRICLLVLKSLISR